MQVPAVYHNGSRTTILVEVGRKNLRHVPMSEGEFVISTSSIADFTSTYELLEYHVGKAAKKYLEAAKYHGISERARGFLMSIISAIPPEDVPKGGLVERKEKMAEAKTPAPKKEAKTPAPKKEAKTPAPKKEAKAPATKKEAKTPVESTRGRKAAYAPSMKITVLVAENPKRGTAAERFSLYAKNSTVEKYLAAGGLMADIRWDVKQGFIEVE